MKKTGVMNLNFQVAQKKKTLTDVQKEALRTKTKNIPYSLGINTWRQVHVTVSGDKISCTIDGKEVGSMRSQGIAHETKT